MNNRLGVPERAPRVVQQLWRLTRARGWTLGQLAGAAGVAPRTLESWRAGRVSPRLDAIGRCFEALGCDLIAMPRPRAPEEALRQLRQAH
jgi:transcriptional regulator with XRE-family HTH domain